MEQIYLNGRTYRELQCCSVCDCGGDGTVGAANLRHLKNTYDYATVWCERFGADGGYLCDDEDRFADEPLIIVQYAYGGESAFMWDGHEDFADLEAGLADYPCIDDELVSEVENEWAKEALPDAWRDMRRTLLSLYEERVDPLVTEDEFERRREYFEDLLDDMEMEEVERLMWRAAMDANAYPENEHSSAYWPVDKLAPAFLHLLQHEGQLELPLEV